MPRRSNAQPKTEQRIGLRERNKQEKLQRIRRAATELFNELGFEKTTTQAIAERADIGAGTLFLYARTKEDLLAIVMANDIREAVTKACSSIPTGLSMPEQAYHVYSRLIRYHAQTRDLSRHYVRERTIPRTFRPPTDKKETPPAPLIVNAMSEVIKQLQQNGGVTRRYPAHVISWRVFALYYGILVHLLLGISSERESLANLRESFEMLFDGIAASTRSS